MEFGAFSNLTDLLSCSRSDLGSLTREELEELAWRYREELRRLVNQAQLNSKTSSKPPSTDNPFSCPAPTSETDAPLSDTAPSPSDAPSAPAKAAPASGENADAQKGRRPGKQPGSSGFWRSVPLVATVEKRHVALSCDACHAPLDAASPGKAHSAHYVLELERKPHGLQVETEKHIYFSTPCLCCGYVNTMHPGQGASSTIEGRKRDLHMNERCLVGPRLASFIAALSFSFCLSRKKIRVFLWEWLGLSLSVGTINRCIHEFGLACEPVVDELIAELREADRVHIDETPWYQGKQMLWLWVAVTSFIVVYRIGSRKKQELTALIGEAYLGWLITDGYGAYRDHPRRQRCLAHLIRKALALAQGYYGNGSKFGRDLVRDLRALIHEVAEGHQNDPRIQRLLRQLKWNCQCNQHETEEKVRALAREILNDWEAVIAFVSDPDLPPTNNDAERALRHAVIARRISFGTRTDEGSRFYAAALSVIDTCRRRGADVWNYACDLIKAARTNAARPSLPPKSALAS